MLSVLCISSYSYEGHYDTQSPAFSDCMIHEIAYFAVIGHFSTQNMPEVYPCYLQFYTQHSSPNVVSQEDMNLSLPVQYIVHNVYPYSMLEISCGYSAGHVLPSRHMLFLLLSMK